MKKYMNDQSLFAKAKHILYEISLKQYNKEPHEILHEFNNHLNPIGNFNNE